jgi:hypothetical protein
VGSRRKLAVSIGAILTYALQLTTTAVADDIFRQCQGPRIIASCPVSCRPACANSDVFNTARAECIRAEDPAVREDAATCKEAMAKVEAKPIARQPQLVLAPPSRSPAEVDVCLSYLQEKPRKSGEIDSANSDDDLIAMVFASPPPCATSTRALLKGFACMKEAQSGIERVYIDINARIPTTADGVNEICRQRIGGIEADRTTARDLEKRAKSIVDSLTAVNTCSAAFGTWLATSAGRCPTNVPVCATFVGSWIKIFQRDLEGVKDVGDKIKQAQDNFNGIRNAASMLKFIYEQRCDVESERK